MKKALVTGAAGFIGANVVRELLEQGVEVRALIKPEENTQNLEGLHVERVKGDVVEPPSLKKAIQGCDTLFHLAAIYKLWLPDTKPIYEVNIRGGNYMLLAARDAGVEKIVYTSSIAALGSGPGQRPAHEGTPFSGFKYKVDYVLTKYISEMNALDMARFGLPLVVVNPALPLGPYDIAPTPTGRIVVDVVNRDFPGYINAGFCVVDVRDVARGHVLAAKKGKVGDKYILGNYNISMKEFVKKTAKVAGVKIRLMKLPKPLMYSYGWAAEWVSERFTHKEPAVTYGAARSFAEHAYFDNTKARTELGLTFRPLEETLRDSIEWFRKIGMIN
jgi:dihydroflavonol-4-reductase